MNVYSAKDFPESHMSKSLKLQIVENARTLIQENNIGVGVCWPETPMAYR
jgi:hypothetical protein